MKFGVIDNIDNVNFTLPELDPNYLVCQKPIPYKQVEFRLGAPVWADKNYVGTLFPPKTPQRLFLHAYAKQFNSIEVNATRFGSPKPHIIDRWKDSVPEDFKFSLKIPQVVTHRRDMNEPAARIRLDEFFVALDRLGAHNGVSFGVMPNYLRFEHIDRLRLFVEHLPKDVPFAIELRDPSWYTPDAIDAWYNLFKENNIIPINTATYERREVLQLKLTNEHLFVRYVGRFAHPSDLLRIDNWVAKIKALIDAGATRHVWFYVHQPGENRQWVVDFFNTFIDKLNVEMGLKLKRLKEYGGMF
jgi:uncharacterized protein YecE (DUF72 family)